MSHLYFYILKNLIPERIWDEKSLWLRVQRLWGWERLRAGREGGNRGWDDWMASLVQWTWAWANSRRWWRTGKPGPAAIHEVTESQTQLNDWTTRVQFEHVWWKLNTHLTNITHTHRQNAHTWIISIIQECLFMLLSRKPPNPSKHCSNFVPRLIVLALG